MIIVLFMIIAVLVAASLHYLDKLNNNYCWSCNHDRNERGTRAIEAKKAFYWSFVCYTALMLFICGVIGGTSYAKYVENRTFLDATVEQYEGAINLYEKHGVINLEKAASMALTDHKYEGYQENMAKFLTTLRQKVTRYNASITSKRIVGNNPLFSWLVIMPDDNMKVLKIYRP